MSTDGVPCIYRPMRRSPTSITIFCQIDLTEPTSSRKHRLRPVTCSSRAGVPARDKCASLRWPMLAFVWSRHHELLGDPRHRGSDCLSYYCLFASSPNGSASAARTVDADRHGAYLNLARSFASFAVRVPPLDEQRAIAHILGTLDDKIELNRRMNETLEAMARALFKSWFVDFDPVRAKAEGRDPGLPKPSPTSSRIASWTPSWGRFRRGGQVEPFSEIVDVIGGAYSEDVGPEYWGDDIPWFSVGDAPRRRKSG